MEYNFRDLHNPCVLCEDETCVRHRDVFNKAKQAAGIQKKVTLHTLRYYVAIHLLEDGVNIYHTKQLLGHTNISTACYYLHLVKIRDLDVISPLDRLYPGDSDA